MKKTGYILLVTAFIFLTGQTLVSAQEESHVNEEIIYNIMVDRFNNGDYNNDEQVNIDDPKAYQGGDLQGIIKRLDDLKETGVTTLSLSPVMANAPDGFHGYWIEDFYTIDEQLGTMEDLHQLIDEAHQRDIKVVLEFVTNYVASSHSIVDNPENEDWVQEENNLSFDWAENVAVLNQENPEVQEFLLDAAVYWMEETDIDGFKLHAVDQASEDFLGNFTEEIKAIDEDFYLLGDILVTDERVNQLKENTEIDAIDNQAMFESMAAVFADVNNPVSDIYDTWEKHGTDSDILFVDNFNTERFTQKFAENGRNNLTAWTLALTYLYTSPGVPSILQGTELPMYGADAESSQRLVPFNSGEPEVQEFHNRISSLREEFSAIAHGDFEMVGSSEAMSVFKRVHEDETIFIAINNSSETQVVPVTEVESGMQLRGYLADNIVREDENGEFKIGIPRESTEVYVVEQDTGLNWALIGFAGSILLLFVGGIIYLSMKQRKRSS